MAQRNYVIASKKHGKNWQAALITDGDFQQAVVDVDIASYVGTVVTALTEGSKEQEVVTVTIQIGKPEKK